MQFNERAKANSQEAIEKRREKERKREQKELQKAAKAAGVRLNTVTPVVSTISTVQNPIATSTTPSTEPIAALPEKKSAFTTGGWSTVGGSSSGGGFKKPGWSTVSSSQKFPSPLAPPPPESSHFMSIPPPPVTSSSGFTSGGWTTLEGLPSASTPDRPLTPNAHHPIPTHYPTHLLPEPAPMQNPPEPQISGFKSIPMAENPTGVRPQPTSQPAKNRSAGKKAEASRSGWQSFKSGGSRR